MYIKRLIRLNSLAIIFGAGIVVGCGPSAEEQAATSVALTAAAATSTPTVTPTHTPTPTFTTTPILTATKTEIPIFTISGVVKDLFTGEVLGPSVKIQIGKETVQTDESGSYSIQLDQGTFIGSAEDSEGLYYTYVDMSVFISEDLSNDFKLIPIWFDMEFFDEIGRNSGETSRWTKFPQFYIDTNTIWNYDRAPNQEEIELVTEVILGDLPLLTDGLISDPIVHIGDDPPVPYTISNRQSDHVAEGWIIVRFDATLGDGYPPRIPVCGVAHDVTRREMLLAGIEVSEGPSEEIIAGEVVYRPRETCRGISGDPFSRWLIAHELMHLMGFTGHSCRQATLLCGNRVVDRPTEADVNSARILYSRSIGNQSIDVDP